MGGDLGPRLTVPSAVSAVEDHPGLRLHLFGDTPQIHAVLDPLLLRLSAESRARIVTTHCSQAVDMDDKPGHALRHKRDSSLWHALGAVADGIADACVSAGNTGALMAMGITRLGMLPGIERPAICTALPTLTGRAWLLDMGANLSCDADHLVQFAHMASAMVRVVEGIEQPRVGLLNIGQEQDKGETIVREAARRLSRDERINYQGFVEGDGIFTSGVDIIVCDGFVGNVALKASEGVARMIAAMLRDSLRSSVSGRLGALMARGPLARFATRVDPANYNGASLLGLGGVVVKSHGGASGQGFARALRVAMVAARQQVPERIAAILAEPLSELRGASL